MFAGSRHRPVSSTHVQSPSSQRGQRNPSLPVLQPADQAARVPLSTAPTSRAEAHHPSVYLRRHRRRFCSARCGALFSSFALLTAVFFLFALAAASFLLWPSALIVSIARLRFDRLRISTSPFVNIDVPLGLDLTVQNRAFFSLDYGSIKVAVGCRGQRPGSVKSDGRHTRARGVSHVESELRVDGVRVINEIF